MTGRWFAVKAEHFRLSMLRYTLAIRICTYDEKCLQMYDVSFARNPLQTQINFKYHILDTNTILSHTILIRMQLFQLMVHFKNKLPTIVIDTKVVVPALKTNTGQYIEIIDNPQQLSRTSVSTYLLPKQPTSDADIVGEYLGHINVDKRINPILLVTRSRIQSNTVILFEQFDCCTRQV